MGVCENPGDLKKEYESGDYVEFYDLSVGDQSFAVAVHNERNCASLLPREEIDSDLEPFESYLEGAKAELEDNVNYSESIASQALQMLRGHPGALEATAGFGFSLDVVPDLSDNVEALQKTSEFVASVVEDARNSSWVNERAAQLGTSPEILHDELTQMKLAIDEAAADLDAYQQTNEGYAVMLGVQDSLRAMGFDALEISAAFTILENVNEGATPEFNAGPQLP